MSTNKVFYKVDIDTTINKENEKKARAEARRLVSNANKRIRRLEKKNIHSEALRQLKKDGWEKFSVKGKTHKEVMFEMNRMRKFMKAESSTITGAKDQLRRTAKRVGLSHIKDIDVLNRELKKFFETTEMIEKYMNNSKNYAFAIGYQKVWEIVSEMMVHDKDALDKINGDMHKAIMQIQEMFENELENDVLTKLEKAMNGEL